MKTLIFDTETNGLCEDDGVLSFSAVVLDEDLNIIKTFERYYFLEINNTYNREAIKVNGLSCSVIKEKRDNQNAQYAKNFCDDMEVKDLFQSEFIFVAHNISFDLSHVCYQFKIEEPEPNKQVCTMSETQYLYDAPYSDYYSEPKWPRLSESAEWACVDIEKLQERTGLNFHSSLFDVLITKEIYEKLQDMSSKEDSLET